MQHRLGPALEIRIGKSIAEVVQREFRDWSRPGPVRMRHRKHTDIPRTARGRAFSGRSAPMSRGLTESANGSPLADRLGSISVKASPSFLPSRKMYQHDSYIRRDAGSSPSRASRNREPTNPAHNRQDNVGLCRTQIDKRRADIRARL